MRTGLRARDAAREGTRTLQDHGVPEPAASAEVLLSELLGVKRGELPLLTGALTGEQIERYGAWISRRANREPVQRILGRAYFRNLVLDLGEETLVPRVDTESVVEAALEAIDRRGYPCRVLDIGTGSGAIAVSVAQERPRCAVHATDTSEAALAVARRNAETADVNVDFRETDIVAGLEDLEGAIDLLVSNPPYIESGAVPGLPPEVRDWDPHLALDGGPDGLLFYQRLFAETPPVLKPGADLVLEVGDEQAEAVLKMGERAGFDPAGSHPDLTDANRAVMLRWGTR